MALSLQRKLQCGFLILDVLTIIGGGAVLYRSRQMGTTIEHATQAAAQELQAVQALATEAERVRYYGNRFVDVGAPDDRAQTLKHLSALTEQQQATAQVLTKTEDAAEVAKLASLITAYQEQFIAIGDRFTERIVKQMEILRHIDEIETTLRGFFLQHREDAEASQSFLFFITTQLHANTYLHSFDNQDLLELMRSLELVEKMLRDGAVKRESAETMKWNDAATSVKTLQATLNAFGTMAQQLRTDIKGTSLPLPDKMLGAAQTLTESSWQRMQTMRTEIQGQLTQQWWVILLAVVGMLAAGIFIPPLLSRSITRPLRQAVDMLRDIAEGEGDLTKRLTVHSQDEIGMLAQWFNTFMDKLQAIIGQVKNTAAQVASASQQVSVAGEQMSAGSQQQASSLEETAASLEEITSTIRQNADNAQHANQLALNSREIAERGGQVASSAISAMNEISQSSKKISDISSVINEIAFQTNLLALNAAVEAARAGEQGRGFAVVAVEVRNLAQRSATATKEIKALISDATQKVQDGTMLVSKSGQALEEIVTSVKQVTGIMGEIARASREQANGIEQVNRAVTQMDQVVQSNAAQTEELSSTAQTLTVQAEQVQILVGRFRVQEQTGERVVLWDEPSQSAGGGLHKKENSAPVNGHAQGYVNGHAKGQVNGHAHGQAGEFEEF